MFEKKKFKLLDQYTIYANNSEATSKFGYPSNEISTTKYTPLTFFPRFFYEQFRRLPNLFFLLHMIISCIPGASPVSPLSAVLPFVLIIMTAAVKEVFEDFKRLRSDEEVNSRGYMVLRGDHFVTIRNKQIQVGDIIHLIDNQEVPADIVLFSTSEKEGNCYVDTANLDGETNLKLFKSLSNTANFNEDQIKTIKAKIHCAIPNEKLYDFKGNIILQPDPLIDNNDTEDEEEDILPIGKQQLLMRGVRIRNTKHVYGVVVYAGKQTKLALNAISPPSKFSETERFINYVTVAIFLVMMVLIIMCTIWNALLEHEILLWYIPNYTQMEIGVVFMCYFVLLGSFIPISLFVNLELLKLIQGGWMTSDDDLTVAPEKGMRVKNTNLNDELSRVSYIFSDKTGTLTQNKMIFDQCTIKGIRYPNAGKGQLKELLIDSNVREFLLNMTLNNEVLPEQSEAENEMPKYAAPSPDEIALVKGAYINGVQFQERLTDGINLLFESDIEKQPQFFPVLNFFEFTSQRKRSSVIVRTPTDEIILYTKGADSTMKPRLSFSSKKSLSQLETHLKDYSREGLRTLLFARKRLNEEEYKTFRKIYNTTATMTTDDREIELENLMNEMEQNLELQGCSAIQDALQDQVPSTIAHLINCGIKVWMITGDQQETAENIGYSCQLITKQSKLARVVKCDSAEKCKEALESALKLVNENKPKVSLVVDGQSLVFALSSYADLLHEAASPCETVIVCRADPLQKALVVRLIKQRTKDICLSIGDGANDVSMLQEAHIGIGIWGEEGTQAANNSDYAIRMFKHLGKLLMVHGRYNMLRTGIMVEYSFYKNIALFLAQFWFAAFCRWSAQTFYDDWVMTAYNVVIVSLPPLSLAIFEKDIKEDVILQFPETYRELKKGIYLTKWTFSRWIASSIFHSIVIYFTVLLLSETINATGHSSDLLIISTTAVSTGVFAIVGKAMVSTRNWVLPSVVAYFLSYVALFGLLLIESSFATVFPRFYKVMISTMSLPSFWLLIALVFVICLFPELAVDYIQRQYFPYNWQIVQESIKLNPTLTLRPPVPPVSIIEEGDPSSEELSPKNIPNESPISSQVCSDNISRRKTSQKIIYPESPPLTKRETPRRDPSTENIFRENPSDKGKENETKYPSTLPFPIPKSLSRIAIKLTPSPKIGDEEDNEIASPLITERDKEEESD